MKTIARTAMASVLALIAVLGLAACEDDSSQGRENAAKQSNYDALVANQPAGKMTYSPTREAINEWVKTWGKRGKLSYVYIQNGKGEYGYFVMKGLPVPRCKKLTPTEAVDSSSNGKVVVAQPGMDGTYDSGSACNAYFGFDATTGAYVEFTVGTNQSFFLFDRPMKMPEYADATQLGPTSAKDVED
ncbi:hypothetical protein OG946_35885 [Streptomyces sp. NBC_01808]|uniref:hypothetical protein n=1 Tax=Streptomyces sp. NBC_01808 TaxID=2975947 RepID=UPI002DDBE216|nr:hypothetical protein [Streptomyces sp. NBC_01808]WSA35916.1 hypothetical protein OG946_00105 [Streptomyces sp. NBC_01808]WSA42285.1 hypothetical protein OG946_35885 [Streptomyces sp. NBC_01808]